MKKLISLGAVLGLILLVTACSINISIDKSDSDEARQQQQPVQQPQSQQPAEVPTESKPSPFYGVWCSGSKSEADANNTASKLSAKGFGAEVFVTTDWSNLNSEKYYVVTAGVCSTRQEAQQLLERVKSSGYSDAYVKYSGEHK